MSRGERESPAHCGTLYYLSHTVLIKDERNSPKFHDAAQTTLCGGKAFSWSFRPRRDSGEGRNP